MNLHGPQSDRDQLWRMGGQATKLSHGKETPQVFDGEATKLREDNRILRNQLQRAMKELKSYQLKYPSPYSTAAIDDEGLPAWSSSPETTAPLFEAYDCRIAELEDTIKNLNVKIEQFQENMAVLVQENEELRASQLDRFKSGGDAADMNPSMPINTEIIAELKEQLEVLRGENNLLMEQRTVLMSELDSHQTELQNKVQESANLRKQLEESTTNTAALSQRMQQAENDRSEAAKQALVCSDALGKMEIEAESLSEQLAVMKQKCKESETVAMEFRRELHSTAQRSDGESSSSLQRVQAAENRVRELHGLLQRKVQELATANELTRKLRSEYQSTRQDAEGMLQVMGGLERQLNDYASREAVVDALAKESRERLEEAMIVKEQCNARDEQNKREIDRLVNERKLTALRRKDELERSLEQSKRVLGEHSSGFEKEMEDLAEKNAKLIFEAEKAGRENRSAKELYERLQHLHEEEHKAVQSTLRDLSEKLEAAVVQREQEAAKRLDAHEQCKELRVATDKLRSQLEEARSRYTHAERLHETTVRDLQTALREQQKESSERSRQLTRKTKELDDVRSALQAQVAALERRYQDEVSLLQRRAADADRSARDLEAAGFAGDLRTQTSIDQLKEKYTSAMGVLEAKLRHELESSKSLTMKNRNSEAVIADLLEEKAVVARMVDDAQETIKQQEDELLACKHTISELTSQLSSSHNAREEGAHRAARTIEELNSAGSPLRLSAGSGTGASFGEHKTAAASPSLRRIGVAGSDYGDIRRSNESLASTYDYGT